MLRVGASTDQPTVSASSANDSVKKPKYLKKPRMPRLTAMETHSRCFRRTADGSAPMRRPTTKSVTVEIQSKAQEAPVPESVEQIRRQQEKHILPTSR